MALGEELPKDFSAPELLAALRQLQAELAATRVDLRTVAERQGASTGGDAAVAKEVQGTTGALNEESAARERNVALAQQELETQRLITAEVERTYAIYAKLAETRTVASTGGSMSAVEAQAAVATQARMAGSTAPVGPIVPAPTERAPGVAAQEALGVVGAEQASVGLRTYSAELQNVSQRQVEFATTQREGGAANAAFVSSLMRGDVTLSEFGSQLGTTVGKFAQWTAAAGGIFATIGIFKELYDGARDSSSGVSQLQRSIDNLDTQKAQSEFRKLSAELNIPIKEASDAVFQMSRTFPHLSDAVSAAGTVLRAQKVDNVNLAESVRSLTAVHQQFGVTASGLGGVFDMLDEGQRRYNARVSSTLQVLGKSAAAVKDAGGSLEQLIQLSVYAARLTGQPGNQIGTTFYRAASNFVQQPTNQNIIKNLGLNPEEAANEFTKFMINAIHIAAGKSDRWKRELSTAIGGKQWGGKVIEPLLSAPDTKLFDEILTNVTPSAAAGSTQRELNDILAQTDERIKALKVDLQQMGAELARAGAGAPLGFMLLAITDTLKATNSLLDGFNQLPAPLREALTVMLELKAAMLLMQNTALGTGVARLTGLSFLGPSPQQQATRAERLAQESSLAGVQSMQGQTLVREQQLRMQAVVNEAEVALLREEEVAAATVEERVAIKERIQALETESVALSQEGNALLTEQAAQQEVATALQKRINELRAGGMPAAGFYPPGSLSAAPAEGSAVASDVTTLAVGGFFSKFSGGLSSVLGTALSTAMKGVMTGIMVDVGGQLVGQTVGGGLGKSIEGLAPDVGLGAGIGSVVPGLGTGVGALGGLLYGLVKQDMKGEPAKADEGAQHLEQAMSQLTSHLAGQVTRAQAGEISPQALKSVQQTLSQMINDPGYSHFRGELENLRGELNEITTSTTDATRALARAALFDSFSGIANETAKQSREHVANIGLKATTTGASQANLSALTQELDMLSARYGGGENKEGLLALQEAETKLLDSSKKNAQDLADKAKVDTSVGSKTSDYQQGLQALDAADATVNAGYSSLARKLHDERAELKKLEKDRGKEVAAGIFGAPGSASFGDTTPQTTAQVEELRKAIAGNAAKLTQIRKATEYESNQLKAAREQAAESAFTDISNLIDAQSSLEQAGTADKTAQLSDALKADNEKLKVAGELFTKNSIDYKKALAEQLKAQQALVDQMVTDIGVQGKLEESEVGGKGLESDMQKLRLQIDTYQRQLTAVRGGKSDPNKIKEIQAQVNEAENRLALDAYERAKAISEANATIAESKTFDEVRRAQIELRAAEQAEHGLTGIELLQQKANVAQKKTSLYQAVTDEKIGQLKYEHDVEKISDQGYIESLEQILATRKMANSAKRSLQEEIYKLSQAGTNNQIFDLAPGNVKLPTVYDVHRAMKESLRVGASPDTSLVGSVHQSNHIVVYVNKASDAKAVAEVLDHVTRAGLKARLRKIGLK